MKNKKKYGFEIEILFLLKKKVLIYQPIYELHNIIQYYFRGIIYIWQI